MSSSGSSASLSTLTCDVCFGEYRENFGGFGTGDAGSSVSLLASFVAATGWPCQSCRYASRCQLNRIEASQAKLTDAVARMATEVDRLVRDRSVPLHCQTSWFPYIDENVMTTNSWGTIAPRSWSYDSHKVGEYYIED